MNTVTLQRAGALCSLALLALPAAAHPQASAALTSTAGFGAGFAHPFSGLDHLLAMLAVGICSARQANAKAQPLTFLLAMALGALTGVAGLTIPGLEIGIAATVALLGLAIAIAAPLPAWFGMGMVAVFALLHGNAHGHELPQLPAAAGFLIASALLLAAGRLLGLRLAPHLLRMAGASIAATGLVLIGMN